MTDHGGSMTAEVLAVDTLMSRRWRPKSRPSEVAPDQGRPRRFPAAGGRCPTCPAIR